MKKAFTHGGRFHSDDVFSAALLTYMYPDIVIERGFKVPEDYDGIVFDIGFGKFDHHQAEKEVRENGVPYAAFGLLWREYGASILGGKEAARFDEKFIQPLDLSDNTGSKNEIAEIIAMFNPGWDSKLSEDLAFEEAKNVAFKILQHKFEYILGEIKAEKIVKAMLATAKDGILVLEKFVPWKKVVIGSGIDFVVYPSKRGGFCAQGVPVSEESQELKYPFLEAWRGKSEEELQKISGIQTLDFCHASGFLVSAATKEDVIKACCISKDFRV